MQRRLHIPLFFAVIILMIVVSCDLNKINLDREDSFLIPNYSQTATNLQVTLHTNTDVIALSDDVVAMAVETPQGDVEIINIEQSFADDRWSISTDTVSSIDNGILLFFDNIGSSYLVGYRKQGSVQLRVLDDDFQPLLSSPAYETFVDTSYNSIDSLHFEDFTYISALEEIQLCGYVYTQGTTFSAVMAVGRDLEPRWFKTYFEHGEIRSINSIGLDTFVLVHAAPEGTDLIMDNASSTAYQKFDLSADELYIGSESFVASDKVYLTGVYNEVGRIIEVDLRTLSTFINEIELYPATQLKAAFLTRSQIVLAGIQVTSNGQVQFASELDQFGSHWCHRYPEERFASILDIIEMPGKGILIAALVERQGNYFVHLTRIDEEGATFVNEYSENCI